MEKRDRFFINGQWVTPFGKQTIEVINPATEEVVATIPEGTTDDVDRAVAAARGAWEDWASTAVAERADYLSGIGKGLTARLEEIAETISGEMGMPLKLSRRIQAGLPPKVVESYVRLLADYSFEEKVANSLVVREPVGTVACITPWNYPLHQVVLKIAPALAAGCTVVLKPSELTPLSACILAEIIEEAGLPPGVFNLVTGFGPTVGEALVKHPDIDMISFTGSTAAGRRVAELAARDVKRVSLELGGKSASVILDDADLARAVKGTLNACYLNSGQTCNAHTRMLVPESRYQEAARLAVEVAESFRPGDPADPGTRLGPVVSDTQRERVRKYIQAGIQEGAVLLTGGPEPPPELARGYYIKPTVFGGVTPDMTIAREEIFGPVLSILTYRDEEEAVHIANDSIYGLSGGVWSGDKERAVRVARRLRTGQVDINGAPFNLLAPFGGFKKSGYGRELGRFGLDEYLETKSLQIPE